MGPRNGILGDNDISEIGLESPQTAVDPQQLDQEKRMAKFSKSAEFKVLREYLEARITYFQTYLPSGEPIAIASKSLEDRGRDWVVASLVINELRNILNSYDAALETVKNARPQNS